MKKSIGARTIVYPAPILVIGTYDREGKSNVMTAAWGGICCSSPPCVAVALAESHATLMAVSLSSRNSQSAFLQSRTSRRRITSA